MFWTCVVGLFGMAVLAPLWDEKREWIILVALPFSAGFLFGGVGFLIEHISIAWK